MKLFRATLDTRHFTFEAFGTTEAEAMETLAGGLVRHAGRHMLDADWADEDLMGVEPVEIETGICLRDGEPIA